MTVNMCDFDHCGRCYSPDRLDDECDPHCPLHRKYTTPKNPSHDPGRLAAKLRQLSRKARELDRREK